MSNNTPNPKDFATKEAYMQAVQERLDYGFCNPMKAKFAAEDEKDASDRWDKYHE